MGSTIRRSRVSCRATVEPMSRADYGNCPVHGEPGSHPRPDLGGIQFRFDRSSLSIHIRRAVYDGGLPPHDPQLAKRMTEAEIRDVLCTLIHGAVVRRGSHSLI